MKVFYTLYKKWLLDTPTALTGKGWDEWAKKTKQKYPIRYFLQDTLPFWWSCNVYSPIKRFYWNINHRFNPKHKYHLIDTKLSPGYYDPDTLILHGSMELLKDFVEIAGPTIDWTWEESKREAWNEIKTIYNWWTQEYPNRKDPDLPELPEGVYIFEEESDTIPEVQEYKQALMDWNVLENEWREEEKEMLIRLMKVRDQLWYP